MRSFFFIFIFLIYGAVCFYVGFRGWQTLPNIKTVKIVYLILIILLSLGYIVGVAFQRHIPLGVARVIEYVGSMWFIFLLYAFMAVVLIDIVRLFDHWFHFLPAGKNFGIFNLQQIAALGVLAVIAALFTTGYHRFTHPKTEIVDIYLPQKSSNEENVLNIALASDLHLGSIIREKTTRRFVEMINGLNPDIILLAGDAINSDLRTLKAQQLHIPLQEFDAPLGVYAVLGNHEYISGDVEEAMRFLRSAGIDVLRDAIEVVDHQLILIGRDDRTNPNRKSLRELTDQIDNYNNLPIVVMDHQPYDLNNAVENNITLSLSGHTHNGQIWPITMVVKSMYELAHGYMKKGDTHFYVSSGLGIWGPPFRIGSQSEVVLIRLHFEK